MRIWTVQPKRFYQNLQREKIIHADFTKSAYADSDEFHRAYDWLVAQMRVRIGEPPAGVTYPFWAWHTIDWQHRRPDLRTTEFRAYDEPSVCLELEIPDEQVLLSDEEKWHLVLGESYLSHASSESEFEQEWHWIDQLPSTEQLAVKQQSWQKIFDMMPVKDGWQQRGRYIQATFWELRLADVVAVRHFKWPTFKDDHRHF